MSDTSTYDTVIQYCILYTVIKKLKKNENYDNTLLIRLDRAVSSLRLRIDGPLLLK